MDPQAENSLPRSSQEIEELMLQELESLFDRPYLIPVQPNEQQKSVSQSFSQQSSTQATSQQSFAPKFEIAHEKDYTNTFLITNPASIFKVFTREQFLNLPESSQCIIIDRLDDILQKCLHNSLILTDHIVQTNVSRENQQYLAKIVKQFKHQSHIEGHEEIKEPQNSYQIKQNLHTSLDKDFLLLCISLCLKLSTKNYQSTAKLVELIKKLTYGKRYLRCHLEYIYQYLKIKCSKLCKKSKTHAAHTKLSTALKLMNSIFESRYEVGPQNYFYFSGYLSGIQVNVKQIVTSDFIKIHESMLQDDKSLPILLNVFFDGSGGFEFYFNERKLYYRILGKKYTPPSFESNGILIGEFIPKKWYFLAAEHEKSNLSRSHFSVIINDKQVKSNLSIDYPKLDKNSKLSMMTVCKNYVGQMSSFIIFKEPISNIKKLINIYNNYEFGLYNSSQMQLGSQQKGANQSGGSYLNTELIDQKLIDKIFILYNPERSHNKSIYDCVEMRDADIMINSGVCLNGQKSKLFLTGGLLSFLPLLEIMKSLYSFSSSISIEGLDLSFNEFLRVINSVMQQKSFSQFEQDQPSPFFNILFHLLNSLPPQSVNNATIQLLAEIRFQIGETKLQEQFFKNLMYSSDFWMNTHNFEVINEFWLFVKAIYAQNPILYNRIFSIQNLIDLMVKISEMKDAGYCCEFHKTTFQIFYEGQLGSNAQSKSLLANEINNRKERSNSFTLLTSQKASHNVQDKNLIHNINKYLAPIAGVLEAVLTSGGSEVLDHIQSIAKSLTVKSSSCFHLQMLKLLKVLLLDSRDVQSHHCASPSEFAAQFLKVNGLQILLYLCSNSSFDVKSMCLKLIDVLSSHTQLIKMAIDPDVITYLCNIILPRQMMEMTSLRDKSQIFKNLNSQQNRMLPEIQSQEQKLNEYEMIDEDEEEQQIQDDFLGADQLSSQNISPQRFSQGISYDEDNETESIQEHFQQAFELRQLNTGAKRAEDNKQLTKAQAEQMEYDRQNPDLVPGTRPPPPAPRSNKKPQLLFGFTDEQDENDNEDEDSEDTQAFAKNSNKKFNQTMKPLMFGQKQSQTITEVNEDEEMKSDNEEERKGSNDLQKKFGILGFKDKQRAEDKKGFLNNTQKVPTLKQNQKGPLKKALALDSLADDDDFELSKPKGQRNTFSSSIAKSKQIAIKFTEMNDQQTQNDKVGKQNSPTTFANENVMSRSNLRQPKQFNFGFPEGDSDSEEEDKEDSVQQNDLPEEQKVQIVEDADMADLTEQNEQDDNGNFFLNVRDRREIDTLDEFEFQVGGTKKGGSVIISSKQQRSNEEQEQEEDQIIQSNVRPTDQALKKRNLRIGGNTGATSDTEDQIFREPEQLQINDEVINERPRQKKAVISFQKNSKLFTNTNNKLNLDTDAINELFTYGGEHGEAKISEEEEIRNFEAEIEELASLCIAAMNRKDPSESIKHPSRTNKQTFESKYLQQDEDEEFAFEDGEPNEEKKRAGKEKAKLKNPRQQFMTPQSVRGIKKIEFSMSQDEKNALLEGSRDKLNFSGTFSSVGLQTTKNFGLKTAQFEQNTITEELSHDSGSKSDSSKNDRIPQALKSYDSQEMNNIYLQNSLNSNEKAIISSSQISNELSKAQLFKKRSSDAILYQSKAIKGKQATFAIGNEGQEESYNDNDQSSDDYTIELENLYTSCLEWIISRAPSSLYENIVIDEVDKIGYLPAVQLLMVLVTHSNNIIRQRAFNDLELLAKWDPNNGSQLLMQPQFHQWLLSLLMPYQDLTSKYSNLQGSSLAVYDIGCKLHTLLLRNISTNAEEEAYKKLNFLMRWPQIMKQKNSYSSKEKMDRDYQVSNKLVRVLACQLIQGLRDDASRLRPQIARLMPTWQNLIYLIFLSEEIIFGSNEKIVQSSLNSKDLNGTPFRWIQQDFLYNLPSNDGKSTWAEWDLVDQILITVDSIYPEWMYSMEKNKTVKIEELIFKRLEKQGQVDELSQLVEVLLHEGSAYKMDQPAPQQPQNSSKPTSKAKGLLRGVLGGHKYHQEQAQAQAFDAISYFQNLNCNSEQSLMKTIMNILCASLIQAESKPQILLLLERFERFVKFLMIVSETWRSRLVNTLYNNYQRKFTDCISFAFAFLFHEIHNTNQQSQRQSNFSSTNLSYGSNTSSPKDQVFNKLYAQSLKNLMVYFINIIEYQNLQGFTGSNETHISACRHIFTSVLCKYYQGGSENLISVKDIMRIKQNDYDDFPECFYMSDWKVAIFNGERIRQIVQNQLNEKQILSFISKRDTYADHQIDFQQNTDKTKEEILKRMQQETFQVIGSLSSEEFERKIKVALLNDNFTREQAHKWKKEKAQILGQHGMWRISYSYEDSFLQAGHTCSSEGVKPYMLEKFSNGFKLQEQNSDLEKRIFAQNLEDPSMILFESSSIKAKQPEKKNQIIDSKEKYEQDSEDEEDVIKDQNNALLISFFSKTLTNIERNQLKKSFLTYLREYIYTGGPQAKEFMVDVKCSILKPFYQRPGQATLTSSEIIFFDNLVTPIASAQERDNIFFFKYTKRPDELLYKVIPLPEVKEIQKRRFLGRNTALELFLMNGKSVLLNFTTQDDRLQFGKKIIRQRSKKSFNLKYFDTLEPKKLLKKKELTEKWMQWKISNFEYLMELNSLAGRSYNDLSQYPVFPWLLVDFSSQIPPDISAANTQVASQPQGLQIPPAGFRDLNKNMQLLGSAERQAEFKRKSEDMDSFNSISEKFHCGSHYSNPGIVLHYLSRISPYIDALVELHGKNLDTPDRGFHSLQESLSSALSDSSDVRELIPEFYFCPEMLMNLNKIKFGRKQDGTMVDSVILPPWCNNSPHLFVLFMREAFESNYVSQNLGGWIDYIFGYKQRDAEAEKSLNLFSHITYEDGVDIEGISDPLMKQSIQEQIYNYGQTPSQLFTKLKHPQKLQKTQTMKFSMVIDSQAKIKVYKPVNSSQNKNTSSTFSAPQTLIQPEAILKARFVDDQTIVGLSKDGTVTYFYWLAKAHEINPGTPFTCCEDKKRKFDNRQKNFGFEVFDRSIKKFDFPLHILHAQKCVLRGGFWGGKLAICPIEGISHDQPSSLQAHTSTVTAINATANDKLILTGSKNGDVIVWNYQPVSQANISNEANWQISNHFCFHEAMISFIHINEDMNLYLTCSMDGTANLHSLSGDKLIRTFSHPRLAPIYSGVLTQVPLPAVCLFSREDHYWHSYSLNGQFLERQKEESSHIISPHVVKDSNFMEKLVYGTEKGYLIFRQLPLLKQLKKQQVSNTYPVLSIIVSPDRRFLLVGSGEGGLNVVTEPLQTNQSQQRNQNQNTTAQSLTQSTINSTSIIESQNQVSFLTSTQLNQPFETGFSDKGQQLSQILSRPQNQDLNFNSQGGNSGTNVNKHQYRE